MFGKPSSKEYFNDNLALSPNALLKIILVMNFSSFKKLSKAIEGHENTKQMKRKWKNDRSYFP